MSDGGDLPTIEAQMQALQVAIIEENGCLDQTVYRQRLTDSGLLLRYNLAKYGNESGPADPRKLPYPWSDNYQLGHWQYDEMVQK